MEDALNLVAYSGLHGEKRRVAHRGGLPCAEMLTFAASQGFQVRVANGVSRLRVGARWGKGSENGIPWASGM